MDYGLSRKRKGHPGEEASNDGDDEGTFGSKASRMSTKEGPEISYTLRDGKLRSDGKIHGATLHVRGSSHGGTSSSFTVASGDAISLLKLADPQATEPTPHPAVVVGFYSQTSNHNDHEDDTDDQEQPPAFVIRVRWLIAAAELAALPADFCWRGLDRDAVLADMTDRDVILSPQMDDLPVQSIVGQAAVQMHWADDDESPAGAETPTAAALTCRYQLKLDAEDSALHLDYVRRAEAMEDGGSRGSGTAGTGTGGGTSASHSSIESQSLTANRAESSDDEDDEAVEPSDEDEKRVVAEGEGSNLRTSIAVGPAFQAKVPPFQPNAAHTISRRPAKLVWKPKTIAEDKLADYLEKAATILNAYLRKNLLTATEPYTPVPNERAQAIMDQSPGEGALTGSSLSTASVLSSARRTPLLKECDVDRLLERIFDVDGDVAKALELVEQEPTRFISTWAQFEKEMFHENFRRHHGAVRKIAKSVAPFKNIQEVIDYQYRFKIPDQFRLYQERKREIAARIVDCIDHRRMVDPSTYMRKRPLGSSASSAQSAPQRWSETTPTDVARSTEDRREKAKQLLLSAHDVLGKAVVGQIANAIKELNRSDTPAARAALFSLLHGHTDLQRRFNEFLPKQG